MKEYDLIVIGSGPAGEKGAAQAAWFGRRVALVERHNFLGGACVNTGTIPSKTLREAALQLSGFRRREVFGVDLAIRQDGTLQQLMNRKKQVVEQEWELIDDNLQRHNVQRYYGTASFISPHEIAVERGGEREVIRGEIILIATGSSPYRPPEIPFDDSAIFDSDSILSLDRTPRSLAVIGAGVIGCEYASIFGALGVPIHMIDARTELLGHMDREIVEILFDSLTLRFDMKLHLGVEVRKVNIDGGVEMTLADGTKVSAEKLLVAAGRSSNTGSLGLENAGVRTGPRGVIPVNERYQTNVPNIYAAGDVIGFPALASTSMEQARVAMVHAFDLKYKTEVAAILPYGIYTIPEMATVGLTEDQCVEKGIHATVGRARYRNNSRGQIIGDEEGMIKLVFDPDTLKLHGVHIVGENAAELLHVGMMVMHLEGTINSFVETVFNYPTLGEAYKYAAYDGLGKVARAKAFAAGPSPSS